MIKKFLAFILALGCAAASYAQNSALAQLGAAGVTEVGGAPMYAHYVIRLGTNGCLSATFMPPGFQTLDWSRGVFIDPVNGVDAAAQTGSPIAPYKSISYAAENFSGRTNSGVVFVLAPGTYASTTLDVGANTNLANASFWGFDPQRTFLSELRYVTAGTAIALGVNIRGVHLGTFYQGNNKEVTLRLTDSAYIDSLTKAYGGSGWTVYREPNCAVTTYSHAYTNIFTHNATNMGYSITNSAQWWGDVPITIAGALNSLAARPYSAAGTNEGQMLYWNGTNWTPQTATTNSGYVLFGGLVPSWAQPNATHISYTNYYWPLSNSWQALDQLINNAISWTNSPAYGITAGNTNFWKWAGTTWSNSAAYGISAGDTNFWKWAATTWSNAAAYGISAGDTNFWTWAATTWSNAVARGITAADTNFWQWAALSWSNAPARLITLGDIANWNDNGTNIYYNYSDTALFTNEVVIADTNSLGAEITSNGTFTANADGWALTNFLWASDYVYLLPTTDGSLTTTNEISLLYGKTYLFRANIVGATNVVLELGDFTNTYNSGELNWLHPSIIASNLTIRVYAGTYGAVVDNVSLAEILRGELYVSGDAHIGGSLIVGNTNTIKFGDGVKLSASDVTRMNDAALWIEQNSNTVVDTDYVDQATNQTYTDFRSYTDQATNTTYTDFRSYTDQATNNAMANHTVTADGGFQAGVGTVAAMGGAVGANANETSGGGAVGDSASVTYGGAVGYDADTTSGGAVGNNADAGQGGAVGDTAIATTGGAIGYNADEDNGGGAVGEAASVTYGGAVGYDADATTGGAIGYNADAGEGGAIGSGAMTSDGFAGGKNAYATSDGTSSGTGIDAIQIGSGGNSTMGSVQFYNYPTLDPNGAIYPARIPGLITNGLEGGVTFSNLTPITQANYEALTETNSMTIFFILEE